MENNFASKIRIDENGCWIYTVVKEGNYGPYKSCYESFKGKVPNGKIVRHRCDNKRCVNPNHLEIGTRKDNRQDFVKRHPRAKEILSAAGKVLIEFHKTEAGKRQHKLNGEKFWNKMTKEQQKKFCSIGGKASFAKLSPEEIRARQSHASKARWAKQKEK